MIWWIDAGAGASGDMLLGALLDLAPEKLHEAQAAVDDVLARLGATESVRISSQVVRRAGLAANQALVTCDDSATSRTWQQIRPALAGHDTALRIFSNLAAAEARVHGTSEETVHFHEVGALDAIADIVAVATLWDGLAPEQVVVSPVCVGSGTVRTAHGSLSVPAPAVTHLLTGRPTFGGPIAHEACTPTGAAVLATLADDWGPQPAMSVTSIAVGAGGRDIDARPNVLRILSGRTGQSGARLLMVETTIDDMDPRFYPDVMEATKQAGALEAWLTPVVMKHGRPATILSCLVPPNATDAVSRVIFENTPTLGVRVSEVDRLALDRDVVTVSVEGQSVEVKRGWLDGRVITMQPEYRDVVATSRKTGLPMSQIAHHARAAATESGQEKGSDATDGGDSDVRTSRN